MPVSSGGSGVPGDSGRLYPWQVDHYFVRGGPNDPVVQTAQALGTLPATLGTFSFNSTLTLPPVPGAQPALNRTMAINLTGTNSGGIYIGTIPQGSWIVSVEFFVYTAFTGGAGQSIGVGYVAETADTAYPTTFTGVVAGINGSGAGTGPPAGLFGGAQPALAPAAGSGYAAITSQAFNYGPGNATTASALQLASLTDINLYVFTGGALTGTGASASVASASAFTAGCAAVRVSFTGLEG